MADADTTVVLRRAPRRAPGDGAGRGVAADPAARQLPDRRAGPVDGGHAVPPVVEEGGAGDQRGVAATGRWSCWRTCPGFDGSPESLRNIQLEYGAEIGRAIVNFDGPIVFCVISRYHGGAFVVFSGTLNDNMEVLAVEGSFASVLGGAPAAAVVFTGEVNKRTASDPRVRELEAALSAADGVDQAHLRVELAALRSTRAVGEARRGGRSVRGHPQHRAGPGRRLGARDHPGRRTAAPPDRRRGTRHGTGRRHLTGGSGHRGRGKNGRSAIGGLKGVQAPSAIPEPVGQQPQHRRVVPQPQMGTADLDVLPPGPEHVPARRPVHDAVRPAVDRRRRHAERAVLGPGPGQGVDTPGQARAAIDEPRGGAHPWGRSRHGAPQGDDPADAARRGPGQFLGVQASEAPTDQADSPSRAPVQRRGAQRSSWTTRPVGPRFPPRLQPDTLWPSARRNMRIGTVAGSPVSHPGSTSTGWPSPRRAVASIGHVAARAARSSPARGGSVASRPREGTRVTVAIGPASLSRI